MRNVFIVLLLFLTAAAGNTAEIEKLGEITGIRYQTYPPARSGPYGIGVDEVNSEMEIHDYVKSSHIYDFKTKRITAEQEWTHYTICQTFVNLDGTRIGSDYNLIDITRGQKLVVKRSGDEVGPGISFIVKNGNDGYMVYYVDKNGCPGAVDTDGKIYDSADAMEFLKKQYAEQYAESGTRAVELGLGTAFRENDVLVWGQTYYSTPEILNEYLGKPYFYDNCQQIQYDEDGNGYQFDIWDDMKDNKYIKCSEIKSISPQNKKILSVDFGPYSTLISNGEERSTSWYIGYGGNIYYYVAGEDYTEVFRIRRTWGEPDLYAMAVNGYTDDSYGKYVKETLAKMSRDDLRMLRNTVYALYGCSFKSENLNTYFGRRVWYSDEGKNAGEIKLPEERKQLVEMVQAAEKKQDRL